MAGKLFGSGRNPNRRAIARNNDGGCSAIGKPPEDLSTIKSRLMLPLAAAVSLGLAFAPAALAQGMSKNNMSKDNMSKNKMEKSSMSKDKGMKKDTMDKKKGNMSGGMKK